jgi:hypothetical protein
VRIVRGVQHGQWFAIHNLQAPGRRRIGDCDSQNVIHDSLLPTAKEGFNCRNGKGYVLNLVVPKNR